MPISENPSFKDLKNATRSIALVARFAPIIRLFGERGRTIANLLEETSPLAAETAELTSLPDRFNKIYRARGWIAFDSIHADAMRAAVEFGEAGDLDAGEAALIEAYNDERMRYLVLTLSWLAAFRPRQRLIDLALEDHCAGRYHASVPVVLAQIDGLVMDVAQGKGFFDSRDKNLKHLHVADSVAGHPEGLAALAGEMSKSRPKTSDSVLALPYRHGILHGRDLGYATRAISTKAFCALAALGEWGRRHEAGTAADSPPLQWLDPDEITWADVRRQWREFVALQRQQGGHQPGVTLGSGN